MEGTQKPQTNIRELQMTGIVMLPLHLHHYCSEKWKF